jgi:glycerol-3-phosphate dehydrogenase
VPLLGAAGFAERWASRGRLAADSGLPAGQVERLLGRYGSCVDELLAFDVLSLDPALRRPLPGAPEYLAAEVAYAALAEGALHLEDVLTRRTRIAIETRDRGLTAAGPAAALMAAELGWDDARTSREVAQYGQVIAAERAAQGEPDDRLAYQALVKAGDPVPFYAALPAEKGR